MKKNFLALILVSMLVSPLALAEGGYGGLSYGQVAIDDIDTGNIGIVLGSIDENGIGYELFYSFTVIDDEDTDLGFEVEAETDTIGIFAVYQTPGDIYLKGKLGYGFVNLKFDNVDLGSASDSAEGLAFGLAGGIEISDGALELTYYRFADLEEFDGIDIDDVEVEMINLAFLWTF